jgi:hypothetical protein
MLPRKVFFLRILIHHPTIIIFNSNCHSRVNILNLAATTTNLAQPELLNFCNSIHPLLNKTEGPLEFHFWDTPDMLYLWNLNWTDRARQGEGLRIDDPVFTDHGTRCKGSHVEYEDKEV